MLFETYICLLMTRHGFGVLHLAHGFKYEGQFKDNFMDGPKGVAYYAVSTFHFFRPIFPGQYPFPSALFRMGVGMKAIGVGEEEMGVGQFIFPTAFAIKDVIKRIKSISHTTAAYWSLRRIRYLQRVNNPTRIHAG
jgi:hypothetical protein